MDDDAYDWGDPKSSRYVDWAIDTADDRRGSE